MRVDPALAPSLTAALPSLAHQVVEATASAVLSAAGQGVGLLRTGLTYGATAAAEAAALAQQLDSASLSEYAADEILAYMQDEAASASKRPNNGVDNIHILHQTTCTSQPAEAVAAEAERTSTLQETMETLL